MEQRKLNRFIYILGLVIMFTGLIAAILLNFAPMRDVYLIHSFFSIAFAGIFLYIYGRFSFIFGKHDMHEMDYVLNDLVEKKLYKESIGKWVAIIGKDYIMGDSGKEVYSKILKKYPGGDPFVFKIHDPKITTILETYKA
jgi:hypothetical protein